MSRLHSFELDKPAFQKNTMQCWWLSLLEIARSANKLRSTFENGSKLHAYYAALAGINPISAPAEGQLPDGVKSSNPELEVYGPEWQRMIMFFLWDKNNKCPWYGCRDTVQASTRSTELTRLLGYLGVTGIAFATPRNLIPSTINTVVNGFSDKQRLIVDKTNHAMSGTVESVVSGKTRFNTIRVYNQATQNTFICLVREDPKDHKDKLLNETGAVEKAELNWTLPLTIA